MSNEISINPASASRTEKSGLAKPADKRLWKVAQEFQEVFMTQVVKEMRTSCKTEDDFFEEYAGRETFDQMFSEAIGKQMAQDSAVGMREAIYRQMGGKYVAEAYAGQVAAGASPVAKSSELMEHQNVQ